MVKLPKDIFGTTLLVTIFDDEAELTYERCFKARINTCWRRHQAEKQPLEYGVRVSAQRSGRALSVESRLIVDMILVSGIIKILHITTILYYYYIRYNNINIFLYVYGIYI